MDNDLIWNIVISLYNDIFDHRKGNKIIYYIISILCEYIHKYNTHNRPHVRQILLVHSYLYFSNIIFVAYLLNPVSE